MKVKKIKVQQVFVLPGFLFPKSDYDIFVLTTLTAVN